MISMKRTVGLALGLSLFLCVGPGQAQQPVLAGLDLMETDPFRTFEDLTDLEALCPGCQVLGDPIIPLRGIPLDESEACPGANLGNTDTIVKRLEDTPPLFPGDKFVVPIQMVELHLQSVEPFQVNCDGEDQLWMVDVTLSDDPPQPIGQMIISKQDPNGGFFISELPVAPLLTFTRVDDCPEVVCQVIGPDIVFQGNGPWCHQATNPPVLEIPGCTSNFVAGCDPAGNGPATNHPGFAELQMLRAHGVLPPLPPKLEQHDWQDAAWFLFWLHNPGGKYVGPIDAFRVFNPRFVPPVPDGGGAPADTSIYLKSSSICNLDPLWTDCPTSWTRVNWDPDDPMFRREAYWFFPPIPVGEMAPEMDIVFSVPDSGCAYPPSSAWYEVDYECFFDCVPVDMGTFRFHCDPLVGTSSAPGEGGGSRGFHRGTLDQNYPNPFNPRTTIRFTLDQSGPVRLTIYDVEGAVVRTLIQESRPAGSHQVVWDGLNDAGKLAGSGTYFYELQTGSVREIRKMIILK